MHGGLGKKIPLTRPNPPYGGLKKIQHNPTHHISPTQPTWAGLNPWVGQIFFFLILITIIIKLSRKKYITHAT